MSHQFRRHRVKSQGISIVDFIDALIGNGESRLLYSIEKFLAIDFDRCQSKNLLGHGLGQYEPALF